MGGRFAKPIFIKNAQGSTQRTKGLAPVTVLQRVPKAPGYSPRIIGKSGESFARP